MLTKMILVGGVIILTGCTSFAPLEVYDSAGNVITNTSGTIGDASVEKEKAVMAAQKSYFTHYAKAYESSGFNMQFALVNINGMQTYLPTNISFKERPDMVAPPKTPSDHPVWGTINTAVKTITPYGFGYLIADSMFGVVDSVASKAGDNYAGPVNMNQSHNTAGNDQIFTGTGPFAARDTAITGAEGDTVINECEGAGCSEETPEYPNDEWFSPGCSQDSHAEGKC